MSLIGLSSRATEQPKVLTSLVPILLIRLCMTRKPKSQTKSIVGEILGQRYVVVEEVGADGPAFRYVVYDTQGLSRTHARVWDEGTDYEIVSDAVPLLPPPAPLSEPRPESSVELEPAKRQRAAPPVPAPVPSTVVAPVAAPAEASVAPPVPAPVPSAVVAPVAAPAEASVAPPVPAPVPSAVAAPVVQCPDRGAPASLGWPGAVHSSPPPPPITIAPSVNVRADRSVLTGRSRVDRLEAAWFVQGEQLEPQTEEVSVVTTDHEALEQFADALEADMVRQYALRLAGERAALQGRSTDHVRLDARSGGRPSPRYWLNGQLRASIEQSPWLIAIGAGAGIGIFAACIALFAASPSTTEVSLPGDTLVTTEAPQEAAVLIATPQPAVSQTQTEGQPAAGTRPADDERRARPKARARKRVRQLNKGPSRRRAWIRAKRDLRRARHAYRLDRYRRARALALRVLRVDPHNRRAAGLKRLAEAKIGRKRR
jgi:hypothetical protein